MWQSERLRGLSPLDLNVSLSVSRTPHVIMSEDKNSENKTPEEDKSPEDKSPVNKTLGDKRKVESSVKSEIKSRAGSCSPVVNCNRASDVEVA